MRKKLCGIMYVMYVEMYSKMSLYVCIYVYTQHNALMNKKPFILFLFV